MIKKSSIPLQNGCYCSQFSVHPKNWDKPGANFNTAWYIHYRFYDPEYKEDPKYKNGKQIILKAGINTAVTLMGKRQMVRDVLANEREKDVDMGYNPISGNYMLTVDLKNNTSLETLPLIKALEFALEKKQSSKKNQKQIEYVLKVYKKAAQNLKFHALPLDRVKRYHHKAILDECGRLKKKAWTANNYNHYRAHISMLYTELVDWDAVEYNPFDKIAKRKTVKRKRKTLPDYQRVAIFNHLKETVPEFWLIMNIFYEAGCRGTELMTVRMEDVSLTEQYFTAVVNKGRRNAVEVQYTISDNALPYWQKAVMNAKPGQYLFAKGLQPGSIPISSDQLTRRWKRHVKNYFTMQQHGFVVTADWYSIKHMHATEMSDILGTAQAAKHNNESESMIKKHYDTNLELRERQIRKSLNIPFVPKRLSQ